MSQCVILREGRCGRLILDRPAALHALDLPLVTALAGGLQTHLHDPLVEHILMTSSGGKAFCAGGDVRAVALLGKQDPSAAAEFFRAEYQLNFAIATAEKPVVALVDGLSLGGGLGISVHARHCLVTARALMGMPEMAIGLFPDVGAGEFLNRLSPAVGKWLALTGARLGPGDCIAARLANGFLPEGAQASFLARLEAGPLDEALALCQPRRAETLDQLRPVIEKTFASDDLAEIGAALRAEATPWAEAQLQALAAGAPTSQLITLEHLRQSRGQGLAAVLERDFRLASHCLGQADFYEGVRAQLIDKDRNPHWQPAAAAVVPDFFLPPEWPDLSLDACAGR